MLQTSGEPWSEHQKPLLALSLWANSFPVGPASSAVKWGGGVTEAVDTLPPWLQEGGCGSWIYVH